MNQNPQRKEKNTKLYRKLYASIEDLNSAIFCANMLIKKGWHYLPWEKRGSIYDQQTAYTTALVVSYGRLFSESKGWGRLSETLFKFNKSEKLLHTKLINLRNTMYAHTDSEHYSIRPWQSGSFKTDIVKMPFYRIEKEDTELFLKMAEELYKKIQQKKDELFNEIDVIKG